MTIQYAGCSQSGLQVQLPSEFITNRSISVDERSRVLLSHWAKYRYGVFDEHGFLGDKLYPLYWNTPGAESEQEKVTSCAATAAGQNLQTIRSVNRTSNSAICSLNVNPATGHPDDSSDCIPFSDREGNDDVVSSLLSHPSLPNSRFFCNKSTHNTLAPNKQNNLCQGASVGQVISRHADFLDVRCATLLPFPDSLVPLLASVILFPTT